jgi:hypothetical protein
MKYIKKFENIEESCWRNADFKIGDLVKYNRDYQDDIYILKIESFFGMSIFIRNYCHYDKKLNVWKKLKGSEILINCDHFKDNYKILSKEEKREIEINLNANKYNL